VKLRVKEGTTASTSLIMPVATPPRSQEASSSPFSRETRKPS